MLHISNIEELYTISYIEKDVLGSGAFGIVRKCKEKQKGDLGKFRNNNGVEMAIKMIRKSDIQNSKTYTSLLLNEIDILLAIDYPKIVKVHNIIEDETYYCIISEIIKGGPII